MSGVRVQVDGLPELIRALRNNAGAGQALAQGLNAIGLRASSESKRAAPTGVSSKLKNSITFEVDRSHLPTFVRIGTIGGERVDYAAYMEYGTGLVHDHPNWPRRPHIVPTGRRTPPGLKLWAKRKGQDPYTIAGAINAKGGLEPRRYLRGPFERDRAQYVRTLAEALRRMTLDG
jgi:hypothetical protein